MPSILKLSLFPHSLLIYFESSSFSCSEKKKKENNYIVSTKQNNFKDHANLLSKVTRSHINKEPSCASTASSTYSSKHINSQHLSFIATTITQCRPRLRSRMPRFNPNFITRHLSVRMLRATNPYKGRLFQEDIL